MCVCVKWLNKENVRQSTHILLEKNRCKRIERYRFLHRFHFSSVFLLAMEEETFLFTFLHFARRDATGAGC